MKDWTGNGNSIFKTLGASNHTDKERETDDFYATSPRAIDALLEYDGLQLPRKIWEPSCGTGCLSLRLTERGYDVTSTDLIDRGFGTSGVNFFDQREMPDGCQCIVTNPPYGERISTPNLLETYKMIGERLKHAFGGNDAWILSYREECFEQIGLKPSIKTPLFNGSLECEFRKYAMFDGKMRNFRKEGGIVKTDEERRAMEEKRRFRKNRAFKERLDQEQHNEETDIRSFKFQSFDRNYKGENRTHSKRNTKPGSQQRKNIFAKPKDKRK